MLRRAVHLLPFSRQLGAAGVSTLSKQDYGLVIQKSAELAPPSEAPAKEVGLAAGVPLETFDRKARIYAPARSAGQSGQANTVFNSASPAWRIEFDTQAKWTNPLIGWTSSADPLENVARSSLLFYTKEEAIAFCTKHGWGYEVSEPHAKRVLRQKRYTGYGDNFSVRRKGIPDLSTMRSNTGK